MHKALKGDRPDQETPSPLLSAPVSASVGCPAAVHWAGLTPSVACLPQKQRAVKRIVKREKREAAQREAQKAAEAFLQISPRKAPGRIRGLSVDASGAPSAGTTPPPEVSSQGSPPSRTDSSAGRVM